MEFRTLLVVVSLAITAQRPAAAGPVTADLSLWLEADNGLATDGSTWADQSGNGHNATAVQGQAPTYGPSAINGLPAWFLGDQGGRFCTYGPGDIAEVLVNDRAVSK